MTSTHGTESTSQLPVAVDASGPVAVRFWWPGQPKFEMARARAVRMPIDYRGKRKRNAGRHHGADR